MYRAHHLASRSAALLVCLSVWPLVRLFAWQVVCGRHNFVCGSGLWTAAVETETGLYEASATEGWLEGEMAGQGEP